MECLTNIVGISANDCVCITDGLTPEQKTEIKKSVSGLYLDRDLEGGISLSDVRLLDYCNDYYTIAKNAIESASRRFSDDLLITLSKRYKSAKAKFIGALGRVDYSGTLDVNKKYQILKVKPHETSRSAVLTINGIRVIADSDAMSTVKIFAVRSGETSGVEVFSAPITLAANRYAAVNLSAPLEFPLYESGYIIDYYFIWERPDGLSINPKDNKTKCNCTGGNAFDGYVSLFGGETDSLESITASDPYSHGFNIDGEIACETGNVVCREFNAQNEVAIISAWAILYKAGELINEAILNSPEINRFTTMNREYLWGKRNHFRKEYEARVAYLGSEIDLSSSDCYICRESRMFVGNIFG